MNRILLALSLLCIAFAACKKSDSNPLPLTDDNATKKALIGTWHYKSDTVNYYTNGVLTESNTTNVTTSDTEQFNNDGTVSAIYPGNVDNFTYSVHNNVIAFIFVGVLENATIKLLTSKTLYLSFDTTSINNTLTYRIVEHAHLAR